MPQSIQIYAFFGLIFYFLWNNYLSQKAFWDNKRREFEVIKLAVEIEAVAVKSESLEVAQLKDRATTDFRRQIEARNALNQRMKGAFFGTLKEGTEHLRDKRQTLKFCMIGASGAFLASVFVWTYALAQNPWSAPARNVILWIGLLSTMLNVPFGCLAGMFAGFGTKRGALLAGILGGCAFAPFGVNLIIALARLNLIPIRVT